jgi:GT2 family glycosyltransferase
MIDYANFDAFHIGVDEVDRGQFEEERQVEFVTGCCMLIRREALQQLGMFDVRYFLYLEDVDLSVRFRRGGYELWFCPGSKIWHVNAGSSGGAGSALHVYYQTRNRLFFFFKYAALRHKTNAQLEPAFAKRLPAQQLSALREEQQRSQPSSVKALLLRIIEELRYYTHLLLLAWHLFWSGTHAEKTGVIDAITLQMGKRAVV